MKTHKHLFDRVCALENILAASREALCHGKRAKPPGARYCAELEKDAVRLLAELLGGTYRHGAYTYFPDGQIRRRGTKRRRPCQAQGLPARPACPFFQKRQAKNRRAGHGE